MYFVGLHFLYAMSSATLIGVGRDADYVAQAIEMRTLKRARQGDYARPSGAPRAQKPDALVVS
jgi:hypothetical protein